MIDYVPIYMLTGDEYVEVVRRACNNVEFGKKLLPNEKKTHVEILLYKEWVKEGRFSNGPRSLNRFSGR